MVEEYMGTAQSFANVLIEFGVKYGFQVLGGFIVLALGWYVAGYIQKIFENFLNARNVDITIAKFIALALKFMVFGFAAIVALGKFGIEIAPLIAGVSVAGVGLSFALQGPLSNYASGITLIFTKPFKVGDIINVADATGEVQDIQLARTILKTVEGVEVVIPNKHIIGEVIYNYSVTKLLKLEVGVSYKADVDKAIRIIHDMAKKDERVVGEPRVGIIQFGDSSVDLRAVLFCAQKDFLELTFSLNKQIFDAFKENGVEIPFPQRDVHIIN